MCAFVRLDPSMPPKAILFDVFGTVVDWRSSVADACRTCFTRLGLACDAEAFADAWRAAYIPSVDRVRSGERPWVDLDTLHLENLRSILPTFGLVTLPEAELHALNNAWHQLRPWPDSIDGLTRLRTTYIVAPVSNASIRMMVNMSRYGGLQWDAILGAEVAQSYKTDAVVYLRSAAALGLHPDECMMVAAHNEDLDAARAVGMRTAFVLRATEHGPRQRTDLVAGQKCDLVARDLVDLADQLVR